MGYLKKLMQDYRDRINDPSYVAPDELRNRKPVVASRIINPPQSSYLDYKRKIDQPAESIQSADEAVRSEPIEYRDPMFSIAKQLGVSYERNTPVLNDDQESELNSALDEHDKPDPDLTERQMQYLMLMTDMGKSNQND